MQLRVEFHRLHELKKQAQADALNTQSLHLIELEAELTRLLKQTVAEGFHSLQTQSVQLPLREQETLHWDGPGKKLKQRTLRGTISWAEEHQGTLLVTSKRIILDCRPHKLWQLPLSRVLQVDRTTFWEGSIIVLWLDGPQKPVGLLVGETRHQVSEWDQSRTISIEELSRQSRTISLGTEELFQLLQTLIKGEVR
jgi:hypothetical protein